MNKFNRLSKTYENAFEEYLCNFANDFDNWYKDGSTWYYTFYPSFGMTKDKRVDFLVYGQAVGGWRCGYDVAKDIPSDLLTRVIEESNCAYEKAGYNPLDWVNVKWSSGTFNTFCEDSEIKAFYKGNNRVSSSFFWNLIYKVVSDYYGYERSTFEWSKHTVWSNLYKIAPESGNPSKGEQKTQYEDAIKLIRMELDEIRPKFCLVLAGEKWWEPFQNKLRATELDYKDGVVDALYEYNATLIIVTKRPYCGNTEEFNIEIQPLLKKFSSVF